jgi:hypothetical protein
MTTNARFCFNNFLESSTIEASGALSGYPATNLVDPIRSKLWKAAGLFEITSSNNKVYLNSTTYTLTAGSYTSATLITHFNSVTSKTLSRDSQGKFSIALGSGGTLDLASTTDAVWATLGYLTTTTLSGTTFQADEARYHTSEWIKVDMGTAQVVTFAALIPAANTVFSMDNATIKLQGNNIDEWTAPPVDSSFTEIGDKGAFIAPDDLQACRFWRIKIVDKTNSDVKAAVAYIGDHVELNDTNIAIGFNRIREDQSQRLYSESGAMYLDRRPKVMSISGLEIKFLKETELANIDQLFYDVGFENPFFLCIDPDNAVSTNLSEMTHYVQVISGVQIRHVLRGMYDMSFDLREVL